MDVEVHSHATRLAQKSRADTLVVNEPVLARGNGDYATLLALSE